MMKPMVTAVIQARMTSTRLPGKVLMEVRGRPLLSYQIERLRYSRRINDIILATTTNQADDPIVALARKEKLKVFRGSENDVLDRYYQTARKFNLEHILRITADCPLTDVSICDRIIDTYARSGADYVRTGTSFAEGFDCGLVRFETLAAAWQSAKLKSEREHVTLYVNNHPEKFEKICVENETNDENYRFTVDEMKDFKVVKAIFENLYSIERPNFSAGDIKAFIDQHPGIYGLNADIIRNEGLLKSLNEDHHS